MCLPCIHLQSCCPLRPFKQLYGTSRQTRQARLSQGQATSQTLHSKGNKSCSRRVELIDDSSCTRLVLAGRLLHNLRVCPTHTAVSETGRTPFLHFWVASIRDISWRREGEERRQRLLFLREEARQLHTTSIFSLFSSTTHSDVRHSISTPVWRLFLQHQKSQAGFTTSANGAQRVILDCDRGSPLLVSR